MHQGRSATCRPCALCLQAGTSPSLFSPCRPCHGPGPRFSLPKGHDSSVRVGANDTPLGVGGGGNDSKYRRPFTETSVWALSGLCTRLKQLLCLLHVDSDRAHLGNVFGNFHICRFSPARTSPTPVRANEKNLKSQKSQHAIQLHHLKRAPWAVDFSEAPNFTLAPPVASTNQGK